MKILIIAPYSPSGTLIPALGAAKKIALFADAMAQAGIETGFINTANNVEVDGRLGVEKWSPASVRSRFPIFIFRPRIIGRLVQALIAPVYGLLIALVFRPDFIWVYNQGFGELMLGYFALCGGGKLINEVEDLPRARLRGFFELKPMLDILAGQVFGPLVYRYLFVSQSVMHHFSGRGFIGDVVPGLISSVSEGVVVNSHCVGYFGGLSAEKGVDILVSLLSNPNRKWAASICGSGELADQIRCSLRPDLNDQFIEGASDGEVDFYMQRCTILINPHIETRSILDGVFPFKLVEYLNTKALIISTNMRFPAQWGAEFGLRIIPRKLARFSDELDRLTAVETFPILEAAVYANRRKYLERYCAVNVVAKVLSRPMPICFNVL